MYTFLISVLVTTAELPALIVMVKDPSYLVSRSPVSFKSLVSHTSQVVQHCDLVALAQHRPLSLSSEQMFCAKLSLRLLQVLLSSSFSDSSDSDTPTSGVSGVGALYFRIFQPLFHCLQAQQGLESLLQLPFLT